MTETVLQETQRERPGRLPVFLRIPLRFRISCPHCGDEQRLVCDKTFNPRTDSGTGEGEALQSEPVNCPACGGLLFEVLHGLRAGFDYDAEERADG